MIEFRHVLSRLYNRPLLILPAAAETVSAYVLSRAGDLAAAKSGAAADDDAGEARQYFRPVENRDGSVEAHSSRASRFYGTTPVNEQTGRPEPYRLTEDGTAIVTLIGELVNRGAWVGASSGLVSYEGVAFQMRRAAQDSKVSRIVLDLESPGGEAVGAFEAAEAVRQVAAVKPVIAFVNGMAASAAYALASAATRIVTIPTGIVGSIGVVLLHLDYSGQLAEAGIKPTLIFAGDHKVDGNPFSPLPETVAKDMQAEVNSFYGQFVETVAKGRKLSADAVRATQARVFKGQDAVDIGLADEVGTIDDVLFGMSSARNGRMKGVHMDHKESAPAANVAGISPEDHTKAVNTAAADARSRVKAILDSKDAQGRGQLAQHLAFDTDMSADAAVALLAKAPKEAEAAKTSRLDGRVPSPQVAADPAPTAQNPAASWDDVVAKVNAETQAAAGGQRVRR